MQSAPERFRAPELINTASSADGPQPRTSSLDVDPDGSSSSSAQEDSSSDDAADAFRQALQASDWGHHASESGGGRHAADEPASPHDSSDWDSESADVSASSSSAGTDEATDAPNADTDADAASAQEVDHNSVSGSGSAAEREARAQTASRPYPPSIAAMAVSDSDGTAGASADSSSGDDVSATAKAPLPLPLSRVEVQRQMAAKELVEPSLFLQALRATLDSKESAHPALQRHARQGCSHRARTRHALVFVAAEAAPYSKTGGLGDVVASLPCALAARGHRVMVITPRYIVDERTESLAAQLHDCDAWTRFELAGGEQWVNYHHEHRSGVDWVYVQHDVYERRGGLYGGDQGIYEDNQFRYALLCLAACEAALNLKIPATVHVARKPQRRENAHLSRQRQSVSNASSNGSSSASSNSPNGTEGTAKRRDPMGHNVVFVANDWHAGLLPVYLKHRYQRHGAFEAATAILAIHNLAHQGTRLAREFNRLSLPAEAYPELEWIYTETDGRKTPVRCCTAQQIASHFQVVNVMKGAIATAHAVVTVSESYAWEVTQASHGVGLHTVLRGAADRLTGIVNGIDHAAWDPATDPHIAAHYSARSLRGKAACKAALRREMGLPEPEYGVDAPVVGFVGRLDPQKGGDLLLAALPGIMSLDCQVVMLGAGQPELERALEAATAAHPDFFRGRAAFSEPLAHAIFAGADILAMPSRFEPCGLNQMYALRYGTVPVACATGGLRDTIDDVSPFGDGDAARGTGWTFTPATPAAFTRALGRAVGVYRDHPARWRAIQRQGMQHDFGWARAAEAYEQVIDRVVTSAAAAAEQEMGKAAQPS